ncbi:MAG: hypothetical protein A2Y12_14775 [Planctomycetes bacterium GWF2_42_9]|nr:MAG: hypothetical protein A2Y12_14775 [Planctomycetes bacterium GWF2_42_9]
MRNLDVRMISICVVTVFFIGFTAEAGTTNWYSPVSVSNISGHAYANPANGGPTHTPICITWYCGNDAVDESISWAVGDFSGYYPASPLTQYQRGIDNTWYGSCAVQMKDDYAGFQLHGYSASQPPNLDLRSMYYQYNFTAQDQLYPWGQGGYFRYSAYIQVPAKYFQGSGACGYFDFIMHLTDTSTGNGVWIVVAAYDSRGSSALYEGASWDSGTNTAMVVSYFGSGRRYLTLGDSSYSFTGTTWSGLRYYAYKMYGQDVTDWATDLNNTYGTNFSTTPSHYRLNGFNLGPEIYVPSGTNGWMSCSLRDVHLLSNY